jgi:hypothetical protein
LLAFKATLRWMPPPSISSLLQALTSFGSNREAMAVAIDAQPFF